MNTLSVAETAKSLANGASRELRAVNHRVVQGSKELADVVSEQGAVLLQNAAAGLQSATRSAKQHPWIASAALVAGVAAIGAYLFSRRVQERQVTPVRLRRRATGSN